METREDRSIKGKKKNPHNIVFIEALIMALFIFGIGILMGVYIEDARATTIEQGYIQSQVNLLDIQTLSQMIKDDNYSCKYRIEKNVEFGNKIYEDALTLAQYEESKSLKDNFEEQHRIYDLLRTIFWINSMELKRDCSELHTLVYFYNYDEQDTLEEQKQKVFSKFAGELKEEIGANVVLIPIAINLDIASLEILKDRYGVWETMILFDEETRATEIDGLEEFKGLVLGEL